MKDATVLVTGGAGYIGSHVVNILGKNGYKTVTFDNLSTGFRDSVLSGDFFHGDLSSNKDIESCFDKYNIDSVMHFAGSIIVPESVEDPLEYYHNNTLNSHRLLAYCKTFGVKNFIFSSTAAVYGMGEDGISEDSKLNPINPYGRSKMMVEMMLQDYAFSSEVFNYVALRYFNVAGADSSGKLGQKGKSATHLIKLALQAALGKRDSLKIFGTDYETSDGTCIRDYIHVNDLAQAHVDALLYLNKEKKSQVLNCGYGNGASVLDVVKEVKRVTGIDFPEEKVGRRAGDAASLVAEVDKIKEVFGWTPKYDSLEEIVLSAYALEKSLW